MKVVLRRKIEKLGESGEVKEVSDGYARNYLLPKGLAVPATTNAIRKAENEIEERISQNRKELKKNQEIADKIKGVELVFKKKVNKGKLFGSIDQKDISKKVKEQEKIDISPNKILMEKPIKEIGEFEIKIELDHGIETELKVIVEEE